MIAVKAGDSEARADGFLAILPHIWGRHESRPDDLIGATIVRFGTAPGME